MKFILKALGWLESRQFREEIESLLEVLSNLNDLEAAELVVMVTHARHEMERDGIHVMHPANLVSNRPDIAIQLTRTVLEFKRRGNQPAASAFMIWGHTMRAALRPELMPQAKQMWRELSRGFPFVPRAAFSIKNQTGLAVDFIDAADIPLGFETT